MLPYWLCGGHPQRKDRNIRASMVQKRNGQWFVINVIVEDVSDLSLKRADCTSYLKKKGFEPLLRKLTQEIQQYAG